MRQVPLVLCVAVCLVFAACDGKSPTSPGTQVPQVAGTYAGSFNLVADGVLLGSGTARMTVVQVGSQLTITGSTTFAGSTIPSQAVTGTINATGLVTITSPRPPSVQSQNCGTIASAGSTLTFSGNTVRFVDDFTTTYCGNWRASGTLRRGGSAQPPISERPVDATFNDRFWQALVFNQHDDPGRIATRRSWVLENPSPNVYIRMGDPTGRRVVSYQERDLITRAVPRLVRQLTGRSYRGRVESGIGDRTQRGWITVRFVTQEEEPTIAEGACGRASIGADPGNIWIVRRARGNRYCVDDRFFPELFAHELGHAMGFFHVADRTAIMAPGTYQGRDTFNAREQYHARLAYEVGRGEAYCGWPFQASCTRRGSSRLLGVAPTVID